MDISKKAVKSRLKISEDVIIAVARLAALDVKIIWDSVSELILPFGLASVPSSPVNAIS